MSKKESNVMKGIAIILMYIHHLYYKQDSFADYEIKFGILGMERTVSIAVFFKICVAFFVFITAYGVAKQHEIKKIQSGKAMATYSLSRYVKLMLGFWVVFLFALLVAFILQKHTFFDIYGDRPIYYFLIDFLGMAHAFGTPTFNSTWWYMSFAVVLIFIMPLVILAYEKIDILIVPIAFLLPVLYYNDASMPIVYKLNWYALGIVGGVVCARKNIFEKWKAWKQSYLKLLAYVLLILGLVLMYYLRSNDLCRVSILDNLAVLDVAFLVTGVLGRIPILTRIVEYLGIYSMNMFLMHAFIKSYFFRDFTYSWKYSWLITIILIADTLLLSVLIEKLKVVCRIDKVEHMAERFLNKL